MRVTAKRLYPAEFRRQVAGFIRETGASIHEVSQALGVSPKTIGCWLSALARSEKERHVALHRFAAASPRPLESDTDPDAAGTPRGDGRDPLP